MSGLMMQRKESNLPRYRLRVSSLGYPTTDLGSTPGVGKASPPLGPTKWMCPDPKSSPQLQHNTQSKTVHSLTHRLSLPRFNITFIGFTEESSTDII